MAYSGYRIKINNIIFPNNDMAKGSYSFNKSPRVCKSWTDLQGISRKTYYPTSKVTITFSIREHLASDHSFFTLFFNSNSVEVEYWDDSLNEYHNGEFEVDDIEWGNITVKADGAFYKATQITLKEW